MDDRYDERKKQEEPLQTEHNNKDFQLNHSTGNADKTNSNSSDSKYFTEEKNQYTQDKLEQKMGHGNDGEVEMRPQQSEEDANLYGKKKDGQLRETDKDMTIQQAEVVKDDGTDSSYDDKGKSTNANNEGNNQKVNANGGKKKVFSGFFQLVAAAIIGSLLTFGIMTQTDYFKVEDVTKIEPEAAVNTTAKPINTSNSVADIAENASEAIVGIVNMSEMQQNPFQQTEQEVKKGVGSGVIYKVTNDGAYIVTNNHVVEGASSLKVSLENGDTVEGKIVGADPLTDIAVVQIKGDFDITPLKFGDSDKLRSGDQVIAIGNPLGLDLSRTVTKGIVSAKNRSITVNTSAGEWDFDVIQTDAAINPGNSGGALIDMNGELIGINSLKIANNGAEGLGFAIPSNKVQEIITELVDNGKVERPYMGVGLRSVSEIPPYYLQQLPKDVKDGAVVLSVDESSAAAKAGLQVEDVIVSIDGKNVTNDKDIRGYLYKKVKIGDTIDLGVYRDGKLININLTLTSNTSTK